MEVLKKLVAVLQEIYPIQETINPFYRIDLRSYPVTYQDYHRLLSHYLTLVYQHHRVMEKDKYVTSREDIIASLGLLELTTLKEYRSMKTQSESLYRLLKSNTLAGQQLTARQISEIIHYSKTQTHRYIQKLIKMDKLEIVSTHHKSIGYLYKLK